MSDDDQNGKLKLNIWLVVQQKSTGFELKRLSDEHKHLHSNMIKTAQPFIPPFTGNYSLKYT